MPNEAQQNQTFNCTLVIVVSSISSPTPTPALSFILFSPFSCLSSLISSSLFWEISRLGCADPLRRKFLRSLVVSPKPVTPRRFEVVDRPVYGFKLLWYEVVRKCARRSLTMPDEPVLMRWTAEIFLLTPEDVTPERIWAGVCRRCAELLDVSVAILGNCSLSSIWELLLWSEIKSPEENRLSIWLRSPTVATVPQYSLRNVPRNLEETVANRRRYVAVPSNTSRLFTFPKISRKFLAPGVLFKSVMIAWLTLFQTFVSLDTDCTF